MCVCAEAVGWDGERVVVRNWWSVSHPCLSLIPNRTERQLLFQLRRDVFTSHNQRTAAPAPGSSNFVMCYTQKKKWDHKSFGVFSLQNICGTSYEAQRENYSPQTCSIKYRVLRYSVRWTGTNVLLLSFNHRVWFRVSEIAVTCGIHTFEFIL